MRKRLVLLTLTLAAAGAVAAGVTLASDEPSNQLAVVRLSATTLSWVDTGIDVDGDLAYPVSATGTVFTVPTSFSQPNSRPGQGRAAESHPAGQIYTCYEAQCPMFGVGYGAVVGKIGENGTPFYVGAGPGFSVPGVSAVGGRLFLAINDWFVGSNVEAVKSGGYIISILAPVSGVVVPAYGP